MFLFVTEYLTYFIHKIHFTQRPYVQSSLSLSLCVCFVIELADV